MNAPTPYSHYLEGLVTSLDEFFRTVQLCYQSSIYNQLTSEDYGLTIIDHAFLEWDNATTSDKPPSSSGALLNAYLALESQIYKLCVTHFKTIQDWEDVRNFLNEFPGSPYFLYASSITNNILHNGISYNSVTLFFIVKTEGRYPKNLTIGRNIVLVDLNNSPAYKAH